MYAEISLDFSIFTKILQSEGLPDATIYCWI